MTHRKVPRNTSKADSRPNLESPRAAGAEDLRKARARLTELRAIGDIAALADQVGNVQQIEYLAEQDEPHTISAERERAAYAQVLGVEAVVERIVSG